MRSTLASESGNDEWTERNPALRRAILRTDKYLDHTAKDSTGSAGSATAVSSKIGGVPAPATVQLDFGPRKS
jgi:hypothetical protein